jgi:hypothetical protein
MACACSKNRARTTGTGTTIPSGTYRVMVSGRQVYETTNPTAAATVADKFDEKITTVLKPGESA